MSGIRMESECGKAGARVSRWLGCALLVAAALWVGSAQANSARAVKFCKAGWDQSRAAASCGANLGDAAVSALDTEVKITANAPSGTNWQKKVQCKIAVKCRKKGMLGLAIANQTNWHGVGFCAHLLENRNGELVEISCMGGGG